MTETTLPKLCQFCGAAPMKGNKGQWCCLTFYTAAFGGKFIRSAACRVMAKDPESARD